MREVLIRFDDNKVAEKFVTILDGIQNRSDEWSGQDWEDWELHLSGILASYATLDALIARPTMSCKCGTKQVGWTKNNSYGWFVCPTCKRPHQQWVRHWLRNIILGSGGKNLLPALLEKIRAPKENDEHLQPSTEDQAV